MAGFDPLYLLFILPSLFVGLIATVLMKVWTRDYKNTQNVNHLSGIETVERIASAHQLPITLEIIDGELTDHYDSSTRTLRLSRDVAQGTTITAVAIAAHELGHALQHHQGSILLRIRNSLVPALNIGTSLGYALMVIGIILSFSALSWVGIAMFSIATIFSLITLPIELDASHKALIMIEKQQLLYADEQIGAKKVLSAAALTYVAAALQSMLTLLYFVYRAK